MSILAKASPVLLLLLLVTATASARSLAENGASDDGAAGLIEANQSHPVSIGPDCHDYVLEGLVKGCKSYTATKSGETLKSIGKEFHVDVRLLLKINPQIVDNGLRVHTGSSVNIPIDAHRG